jgi:hypothetical protein
VHARQCSLYLPVVSEAAYEPQNYGRSLLDWCSILIMLLWLESLILSHVKVFPTSSVFGVVLHFLISLQCMEYREIYVVNFVDI